MIYGNEIDAELLCELLMVLEDLCELRPDSFELLVESKTNFERVQSFSNKLKIRFQILFIIFTEKLFSEPLFLLMSKRSHLLYLWL